jgi:5-methylthioadenosine/S-adenosylhomocysteine deaminase
MIRYHARWVVPVAAPPIRDGTVCVDGARIAWVGPRDEAPAGRDHDLGELALIPGLVNAHTHLELTVMRGFLEALDFKRWIYRLTSARREVLSPDDLLQSARLGIAEGLLAGVTTYADTCESGVVHEALREMGVRGIMYQEVFGPDPSQRDEALAGLRAKVERLRACDTPLVRTGVSPHAPYSVSDALFAATAAYARDESLPIAIHIAESDAESRYVRDADGPWAESHRGRGIDVSPRGRTPIAMLEANDVLRARPLLIHCVRADGDDLALVRDRDCAIAHCPASNAKLGHGVAPLAEMLELGIRVGIGSDSVASNNRMDILDEARLASLVQRARAMRFDLLDAAEALELATLGGARALGLDDRVGTLEAGKEADLAAFPLDTPRELPIHDPASQLVFAGAARPAAFVAVAGRVLVEHGRLVDDRDATMRACRDAGDRLARWAADRGSHSLDAHAARA